MSAGIRFRVPGSPPWALARRADSGFSLIEVVVAMAVINIVMASLAVFYVRSMSINHHQGQNQGAAQVATAAMERVRAAGGDTLLHNRDQTSVQSQPRVQGVNNYLADTELAWDDEAALGAGASAPLPTTAIKVTLGSVDYWQNWYVGKCWQTGSSTSCTAANKGAAAPLVEMVRVVVAVTWRDKECPAFNCAFFTSTLVSEDADPVWGASPTPTPAPTPAPTATGGPTPGPTPTSSPSATPSPTPAPSPVAPAAIWVNRNTNGVNPAALWVGSSALTIDGLVHTNSDLVIEGSAITSSPRVEYVTAQTVSATSSTVPGPVKVAASYPPPPRNVANYKPGGSAATAAGSGYYAAPCSSGTWTYGSSVPASATVVYANCSVNVTGTVKGLLVAEGTITIAAPSITVGDVNNPKAGGLVSNSTATPAILLSGSSMKVYGNIQAAQGGVTLLSSLSLYQCGIWADIAEIRGSNLTIDSGSSCA